MLCTARYVSHLGRGPVVDLPLYFVRQYPGVRRSIHQLHDVRSEHDEFVVRTNEWVLKHVGGFPEVGCGYGHASSLVVAGGAVTSAEVSVLLLSRLHSLSLSLVFTRFLSRSQLSRLLSRNSLAARSRVVLLLLSRVLAAVGLRWAAAAGAAAGV
eukprot:SAG31_NODE_21983_length_536_cov_1.082380_1_plen_154_part_01